MPLTNYAMIQMHKNPELVLIWVKTTNNMNLLKCFTVHNCTG